MGILSAYGLPCGTSSHVYDFSSDSSQVYGGSLGYKELAPGKWGMVSGDADQDGLINNADKYEWSSNAGASDYYPADYNLDGQIDNSDKIIWEDNQSYIIQVPE
jgi:hypothetical protein